MSEASQMINIIKKRRLRWYGHMLRLPQETPLAKTLDQCINFSKNKKRGQRRRFTWLSQLQQDTQTITHNEKLLNLSCLRQLATDRTWWRNEVVNDAMAVLTPSA